MVEKILKNTVPALLAAFVIWLAITTNENFQSVDRLSTEVALLSEKIDAEFGSLSAKMDLEFGSLGEKIDTEVTSLSEKIDAEFGSLRKEINDLRVNTNIQFIAVNDRLDNIAEAVKDSAEMFNLWLLASGQLIEESTADAEHGGNDAN